MELSYRLNASYHNGLISKFNDKPYGSEVYIPEAYPNHFYNNQQFSPLFLAGI